jgi:hypothetical protein
VIKIEKLGVEAPSNPQVLQTERVHSCESEDELDYFLLDRGEESD